MEKLEALQINDSTVVFTQSALDEALQAGRVEQDVIEQLKREAAAQAVADTLHGARDALTGFVGGVATNIGLEARMFVFDKIHGTNYRGIRHALIEEKRKRAFEESIGLSRQ